MVILAEGWTNRCALHALPFFDPFDEELRSRRNATWNLAHLAVQALALASYAWTRDDEHLRALAVVAFAVGFYGWIDLTLCTLRKTLLLTLAPPGTAAATEDEGRLASAWLLFISLSVIYANLFCALGLRYSDQFAGAIDGPASALALSASTITTVGHGALGPKGAGPVVLAFMEALSGLALLACVIATAVTRALSRPELQEMAHYLAPGRPARSLRPAPRLVPALVTVAVAAYGLVVGLWILGV